MVMLGRFLLELLRIIALLILIPGLLIAIITLVFGLELTEQMRGVVSFIGIIAMVIWYRRRGQYNGWFKVDREG